MKNILKRFLYLLIAGVFFYIGFVVAPSMVSSGEIDESIAFGAVITIIIGFFFFLMGILKGTV